MLSDKMNIILRSGYYEVKYRLFQARKVIMIVPVNFHLIYLILLSR